jgi:hypothetical protein
MPLFQRLMNLVSLQQLLNSLFCLSARLKQLLNLCFAYKAAELCLAYEGFFYCLASGHGFSRAETASF